MCWVVDVPAIKKGAIGCAVDVGQLLRTMPEYFYLGGRMGEAVTIEAGELFA